MFNKRIDEPKESGKKITLGLIEFLKSKDKALSRSEYEKIFYSGGENFKDTLQDIRLTMKRHLAKTPKETTEDVIYLSEQIALVVCVK